MTAQAVRIIRVSILSLAFVQTLEELIKDVGFNIQSPLAVEAISAATKLLEWRRDSSYSQTLDTFSSDIMHGLVRNSTAANMLLHLH